MRILIITDLYPPFNLGGYELRCKETADEFGRRGHDVSILTSRWGGAGAQVQGKVHRLLFFNAQSNPDKPLNSDPLHLRRRYYQFLWMFISRKNYMITHELISTIQPDLAFFWNMKGIGVTPVLAAQDLKLPTVFSLGDYWLLNLKTDLYDNTSILKRKFLAVVTGLGNFSQLDLRNLLPDSTVLKQAHIEKGFPEENLQVIPRGIQSSLILPVSAITDLRRNLNGIKRLLFVGRITPEKAPDVAINAINILRTEHGLGDIQLDIVGQGSKEYVSSLKNLIINLKLEMNVSFLGWLEHSSVLELYSDYDALLFPSRWVEPLGGTVLEAMARGLPVIASRRGGPAEIILDGENGLLVEPDEPSALAGAILRLLRNGELAKKIRVAGIKTINERYTLEKIVDRNLEYIQKMLAQCAFDNAQRRM